MVSAQSPQTRHAGDRYDPTTMFSDMQWFMFRQSNIVHYAAFATRSYDRPALVAIAQGVVRLAPQLLASRRGGNPLADDDFARLVSIETVADFAGFPEAVIDSGTDVVADPDLPMFRIRAFNRAGGADSIGRSAFLLVRVSHALVEGADSALLSRSQSAAHPVSLSASRTSPLITLAARSLGGLAALAHLVVGNLYIPKPGPYVFAGRVFPRALISTLARQLGVSQRALFFALVMHALFGGGTSEGKRRISSTYSVIDHGGGQNRDTYMRMRMLFSLFANAPEFPAFARSVDARLRHTESHESGFNAELNAAAIGAHRRLARLIGFAYRPQVFAFMPYDIVIGLIPPHRLGGPLTEGLLEPVYCGATTPGANACVIVPGRTLVSFNFFIQQHLVPKLTALDKLLGRDAVNAGFSHDL